MIEAHPNLVNFRGAFADLLLSLRDVLTVLATTGITTVDRSEKRQRARHAVVLHLLQGILEHRMPISIAPVNRQVDIVASQFLANGGQQLPVLLVDRTDAAEVLIVLGHLQHSFSRHIFASQHVFQKRHHIVRAFRTTKRDQQQRVKFLIHVSVSKVARKDSQHQQNVGRTMRATYQTAEHFCRQPARLPNARYPLSASITYSGVRIA